MRWEWGGSRDAAFRVSLKRPKTMWAWKHADPETRRMGGAVGVRRGKPRLYESFLA